MPPLSAPLSAPSNPVLSLPPAPLFHSGSVLQFAYPTDNRVRVSTRLVRRQFVVDRVRDLQAHPLDPLSYQLRPALRRGQLLVIGHDLASREWRQFYVDSMRSLKCLEIHVRRLALFDPITGHRGAWIGPVWTDSREDLQQASEIIRHFNTYATAHSRIRLLLGLFDMADQPGDNATSSSSTGTPPGAVA